MTLRLAAAALATVLSLATSRAASRAAPPDVPTSEYAARRARLAERLDEGAVLVAQGAPEPEQDYNAFFQASPFLYLTGYREAGATLVMTKRGGRVSQWLFVQPRIPAQEVWSGHRLGAEGATALTGIPARPAAEARAVVDSLLGAAGATPRLAMVATTSESGAVAEQDRTLVASLGQKFPKLQVVDMNPAVQLLRGHKSEGELALLHKAIDVTVDAQREAARLVEPGVNEFEVQALIEYTFRRDGAERPGFATIVGSGPNATTLHYNADDRFMQAGDLVVMDIGASYRGYSADVTRTLPVSGTFTPDQRAVYQVVRDAQAAAERQAKPGALAARMDDSATAAIQAGLARLGLIEAPNATYDCDARSTRQCPQFRLYYMHGLGHGIGLDVHDPDQYYETGRLAAGSAFTIEPGIYVRANLLDVIPDTPRNRDVKARIGAAVKRFANVGVRIEDDYFVTDAGVEWVSRGPREAGEVEALMREPYAGTAPRDTTKVGWYQERP